MYLPLLSLPILAGLLAAGSSDAIERPHKEWRQGPVRYVITPQEDREFQQLSDDDARARFIESFWDRRDPDPRTLVNEYRFEFWKRVATANRFFTESSKPGWKSDMGRIHILLGPPDDRDTDYEIPLGLGPGGVRGAVLWRYRRSPHPQVGPGLTIVFTKDASGEFRLETDPGIVQQLTTAGSFFPNPDLTGFGISLLQLAPRINALQLMLDLGRLEEVPSQEDLLTAIVTAEEFLGALPFSVRYDFFAGQQETTIVAITLSLLPDPLEPARADRMPDYSIVGRLDRVAPTEEGTEGSLVMLMEHDFSPSPINGSADYHGPYIYQTVTSLRPGTYRASFAAFDRLTHQTGSYAADFEVPGFATNTLTISSLCLSDTIREIDPSDERDAPYVFGHLKVTPRLVPTYSNGETFAVYFQVYSALTDPVTSTPDLEIRYQFFVKQDSGYLPIGKPILLESVGNSAQGWSFPIKDWPRGEFRLQVSVTDQLAGQTARRQIEFQIL